MKTKTRSLLLSALALGVAVWIPAFTFGEDQDPPSPEKKRDRPPMAAGKISAIDAKHIEIKTQKGETITILLTDATRYGNKKESKQFADFHVGDMAMVAFDKAADGSMTAKRVMAPRKGEEGGKRKKAAQ